MVQNPEFEAELEDIEEDGWEDVNTIVNSVPVGEDAAQSRSDYIDQFFL